MTYNDILATLKEHENPEKAGFLSRFFKTGPGEYAEGDIMLGISVPTQRQITKQYKQLPLPDVEKLLQSPLHECRLTALFILVDQYKKGDAAKRTAIYNLYLANTRHINNWDLVDSSAEYIVGPYLENQANTILKKLATSSLLWDRRIAMLATFHFIKKGEPERAFPIAEILLHDKHDLIQKAVGWMLREIGKRCSHELLVTWLTENGRYTTMPRTALRYTIEHFSPSEREQFLKGTK